MFDSDRHPGRFWGAAVLLVVAAVAIPIRGVPLKNEPVCGYDGCPTPKEGFINLHIVPHTHNDVGWLKTVDQYFYGSKDTIQNAEVQYIIDTVVQALAADPERRFIYVETAFFWKWWLQQNEKTRHLVKTLVNRGQLEFIGGGWSMNDEATTHYQSIIDQFSWGFKQLHDAFGECGRPRIGWQIDPFGHSRENAAIMAKLGFDGLFLGRIDWEDKNRRLDNKTTEMIWYTSANDQSDDSKLFTGVMYNGYSDPTGFCFDINCPDEPIIDDPTSPDYNVNERVGDFLALMTKYSKGYSTNNIIVTMGGDFVYKDADKNFKNMDKLIKHINEIRGSGDLPFNAFYSTPSCYLKAVHDSEVPLPTKSDDFFPYSHNANSFWTGYFTSRPSLKRFERVGNNYLQICKQLSSLSGLTHSNTNQINVMREAMGILQHHDAVSGTEKQLVADDYARKLYIGFEQCGDVTAKSLRKLMGTESPIQIQSCLDLNVSSCSFTETNDNFILTVYNPLSRQVSPLIRLPVNNSNSTYTVKCHEGKEHVNQVTPLPTEVLGIPGRKGNTTAELSFVAPKIPPLGFKSFYISKNAQSASTKDEVKEISANKATSIGYDGRFINLDDYGQLTSVTIDGRTQNINIGAGYYQSQVGSGAYIFEPGTYQSFSEKPVVKIVQGELVSEVRYKFSDWVSSILRVYKGAEPFNIEHEWLVGPIPTDGFGKEAVFKYHLSDVQNQNTFWTDSNGREMLKRVLNYRPTWPLVLSEPVSGNYYPVTTRIALEDGANVWSVVTDRAEGGTSLENGTMELMVHRRLTDDDGLGVNEVLSEEAYGVGLVARGIHYLVPGSNAVARKIVQTKVLDSWKFFTPTEGVSFDDWQFRYKMFYQGLKKPLSDKVQILTLEPWSGPNTYILRLEHVLEQRELTNEERAPVTVDINDLFADWEVMDIKEMALGANIEKSDVHRLNNWKELSPTNLPQSDAGTNDPTPSHSISLKPMEIKTFIIKMKSMASS